MLWKMPGWFSRYLAPFGPVSRIDRTGCRNVATKSVAIPRQVQRTAEDGGRAGPFLNINDLTKPDMGAGFWALDSLRN